MKANMIEKAILITDAEQVRLCADFRANGQKILFKCYFFRSRAAFSRVPKRHIFLSI